MLHKSGVLKFETVCQGQCVNRKYFGCNILGKILAKISARIFARISAGIFAKIQNFGSNLNKIFYKIIVSIPEP